MVVSLKSPREIELMRQAGQVVAEAHTLVKSLIAPGVTTREIDQAVEKLFEQRQAKSLFKNFPGKVPFPAVTCMSLNEVIVHGIPGDRALQEGDILSVDTGCQIQNWCGDSAWTYAVGQIDEESQRLMVNGKETLRLAVELLGKCDRWSQVASKMELFVKRAGFSVVTDFVGHGIGRKMHEAPQVPNYWHKSMGTEDFKIQPGLVLAIEPMINAGKPGVKILKDHWTAVTVDGKRSVHFEHTVAVTENGPILLTEGVGGDLFDRLPPF